MANYFYIVNGAQNGPISENQLKSAGVTASTLVWADGMSDWTPAGNVPALQSIFAVPTPPPIPSAAAVPPTPPTYSVGATTTQQTEQPPIKPNNYLVWAILSTVLCCVPLGIVAIVFSSQVDTKYSTRDYAGAQSASEKAKLWSIISGAAGLVAAAIGFLLGIAGAL